jgi:pimeloyl-ACP methyl ester carboxylesterase
VGQETWREIDRLGFRIFALDFDGSGDPVLLLHGLAGYAGEWSETASWLSQRHHVVALEQRGHGRSDRTPSDMSIASFVGDAEACLLEMGLTPSIVIGQSLGGLVAFVLAGERPDLVRRLIVVEATPEEDPDASTVVRDWLESWPVPFSSRSDALAFFGGDTTWARAWAGGLEERNGSFWPAFDTETLVRAIAAAGERSYWDEWRAVRCPTLVVRAAGDSHGPPYQSMVEANPNSRLVEIEDAGHDLHLDQPSLWRHAVEGFLGVRDA